MQSTLTTTEIAEMAGVHPRTIAVRVKERGIEPVRKIGTAYVWSAADAARLVEYVGNCNRWDGRFKGKRGKR